jgi:hypothetical protein
MGSKKGLYNEEYSVGTIVRIISQAELRKCAASWKKHHPLDQNQLEFGGHTAKVKEVSFYHGGDELYVLENIPGIWHECCLKPLEEDD